jgi:hypothetical protein
MSLILLLRNVRILSIMPRLPKRRSIQSQRTSVQRTEADKESRHRYKRPSRGRSAIFLVLYASLVLLHNFSLHVHQHVNGDGHAHDLTCLVFGLFEAPSAPVPLDHGEQAKHSDADSAPLQWAGASLLTPLPLLPHVTDVAIPEPAPSGVEARAPSEIDGFPRSARAPPTVG